MLGDTIYVSLTVNRSSRVISPTPIFREVLRRFLGNTKFSVDFGRQIEATSVKTLGVVNVNSASTT